MGGWTSNAVLQNDLCIDDGWAAAVGGAVAVRRSWWRGAVGSLARWRGGAGVEDISQNSKKLCDRESFAYQSLNSRSGWWRGHGCGGHIGGCGGAVMGVDKVP